MQCLSFVVSSDFHHIAIVWEKQWTAAHVCIFMPDHDVFLQWVGNILPPTFEHVSDSVLTVYINHCVREYPMLWWPPPSLL